MKNTLLAGLAEAIGTAILVFMGCMGCVASLGVMPSHLQISLTFGLAVMVVIQVSGLSVSILPRNRRGNRIASDRGIKSRRYRCLSSHPIKLIAPGER